ncbi:hypothetical protein ES332_D07G203200v1 [Gossypium tomentosum]|uniref:Uncharacterized protein n=1 Tax=Gossypium tomentosum TaxID=34277 RepID=A0A5D2KAG4_GOSTO|nr:hypothetical protein ES332_D07G203200v1 [Gossypium tomentosum]
MVPHPSPYFDDDGEGQESVIWLEKIKIKQHQKMKYNFSPFCCVVWLYLQVRRTTRDVACTEAQTWHVWRCAWLGRTVLEVTIAALVPFLKP